MSWSRILQTDPGPSQPLRQRIAALFAQQRQTWPTFRAGEESLPHLPTKTLTSGDDFIIVQLNAARRSSILAQTDAKSIAARACFLCPQNMPPEERGLAFRDLVVLPNPCPCLPMHVTIAARDHVPQKIEGRIASFLHLARELGPELAVTYNGPRCGASAPDHFHFQCVQADGLPILRQLPPAGQRPASLSHHNFGRQIFVFTGPDVAQVQADVERNITSLAEHTLTADEPLINLAAWFDNETFTVLLFPRTRHRPASYFSTGPERLIVSPGILEMCGLFIVTDPSDFDRIDARAVRSIYAEVCGFS